MTKDCPFQNYVSQKESEKGDNYNNLNIYSSMAQISGNEKSSSRNFDGTL